MMDTAMPNAAEGTPAVSVMEAVRFAYRLLLTKFLTILGLLWLPLLLAGVSLYFGLLWYFEALLRYLANPDPKVASLALGILSGGVLLALFFWSMAVSAVANLASGTDAATDWLYLRTRRQEWRLYAGYLRFLLLFGLLAGGLAFFLTSLGPLLPMGGVSSPLLTLAIVAALFWFTARVGFLMAPIVVTSSGMILRASWHKSEGQDLRIAGLMLILMVPTALVQIAGEIVLGIQKRGTHLGGVAVADYAHYAEKGLGTFIVIVAIGAFFAITLLTAGAMEFHRQLGRQKL